MPSNVTQFKPGNPGRPPGSRNKLSEDFFKALYNDFQAHGAATIAEARERDPVAYVRMIAGLLPKDIKLAQPKKLIEYTDAELLAYLVKFEAKFDGHDDDADQAH